MDEITDIKLSDKEILFAEAYLVKPSKAFAARKAGCPANSAKEQGYEIYNRPHVKAYIENKLKEIVMTGDEAVKLVSDIANSDLTDYYVPVKVVKRNKIKVGLSEVIKQEYDLITREEIYRDRLGIQGEELEDFNEGLKRRRAQILRLEIELETNPKAYRIIDSEPFLATEMKLDINLLVADKERGRVKKIKYGKDGLEVEGYSAMDAAEKILKINGKYEKDNSQKVPVAPEPMRVEIVKPKSDD